MRGTIPLVLSIAAAMIIVATTFAAADSKTDREIKDFLARYQAAYSKKDVDAIMKMIAPEAGVVFFEADEKGRYVGQDQIRAAYEGSLKEVRSVKGEYKWTSVGSRDDVGWFATEVIFDVDTGEDKFRQMGRWSGVLEKKGGKWLLIQSHFSFPEESSSQEE